MQSASATCVRVLLISNAKLVIHVITTGNQDVPCDMAGAGTQTSKLSVPRPTVSLLKGVKLKRWDDVGLHLGPSLGTGCRAFFSNASYVVARNCLLTTV